MKEKLQNPGWKSSIVFAFLLMVALGNWGTDFETWGEILTPSNIFGLVVVIGTVGGSWLAKPPLR